jgi:myo-inositol-1(or 4)-monophosphatase
MGSAALNFCAVAAGYVDAFWVSVPFVPASFSFVISPLHETNTRVLMKKQEGGCWAWDVAAGWIILEEAGGIVVGANPGNWEPTVDGRKYLAIRAAPSGQKEIIEELWSNVVGTYDYTSWKFSLKAYSSGVFVVSPNLPFYWDLDHDDTHCI